MPTPTTRLAPSPTGALHLGNLRTFLLNWGLARRHNWRILMRIEDLDGPRIKPGAAEGALDTLAWIGIDWDNDTPLTQSHDLTPYHDAMSRLAQTARAYPCDLTRKQIEEAASAPHDTNATRNETRFPPALRPPIHPRPFDDPDTNWRFPTPDKPITFHDLFHNDTTINPAHSVGDFVLWTRRALPAYQLAVVVDDARQHVTHVVRADDLLDSTARQLLLYEALGLTPPSHWAHPPLVLGPDGRRLAKRHGDTRIDHYRNKGVPPQRLIGLCAHWCGIIPTPAPLTAAEFAAGASLDTIPREPVIFTKEDDAWLLDGR